MHTARIAGVFYLMTFVTGVIALASVEARFAANLIATGSYVAVTLLFYPLFKPVNPTLSLVAMLVSLAGLVWGALNMFRVNPITLSPLAFFGVYCLLLGYLVYHSGFMPSWLGVLLAFGGIGWLTFAWPALANQLSPYNFAPGMMAEGVLTLWLLAAPVDARRLVHA